ncbi:antitoxin VapB [Sphingomonas sp. PP-F2F-A104-K0414]|uniref:AbrB/MazE/SpoVT family DNA-binding domain-containing protein n=1 Tax=Sphingomonas sp. PP-F2F-A104-K0414 TaxID=2135661 RepID=UPI001051A2A5|nr:AbrB/MazE/SpoVT family DNA-binding domain-containing protein [Sphingomonas sp. PP-F2F-A104-K0414]TCP98218.1 antitoxin VapB [Sphingomonas sp. PP-F2F-A104-K0414]
MAKEYRAKVFKSGNSVALRLPKALGIVEGAEMTVREDSGKFIVEPYSPVPKKIDLTGIYGSIPGLKLIYHEDRIFDPSPRPWDDPSWPGRTDEP